MASTIIGLFDSRSDAEQVVRRLSDGGFDRDQISLVQQDEAGRTTTESAGDAGDAGRGAAVGAGTGAVVGGLGGLLVGVLALPIPGIGPVIAAGPIAAALTGAGVGAAAGGIIGALTGMGVPEDDARTYEEGVRRGGTLVTVTADDARADAAAEIMRSYGAVNVDERAAEYSSGTSRAAVTSGTTAMADRTDHMRTDTTQTSGERAIPVIEEEVHIGKEAVRGGGVRVYTTMTERPIEESVTLREEHVSVQRRPADRAVSAADVDALRDGEIEVTETSERAVVSKEARVVEEVVIDKDVQERTETVRDSVRKTDVQVERVPGATTTERTEKTSDRAGSESIDRDRVRAD